MLPHRAQPVVVHLPGHGEHPAYVHAADDRSVTLVLAVRAERPPARPGDAAVVEFATASGIHRIAGAVVPAGADPSMLAVERHPPEDEVIQRREWARADASVPVAVRFEDEATGAAATVSVNLSGGGALLRDPGGLSLGDAVQLRITVEDAIVTAAGVVVRETAAGDKGVRIVRIADRDRERLVTFVALCQRRELARRREAHA